MNCLKLTFCLVMSLLFQDAVFAQGWTSYQSQSQINDLVDTGDELYMATDIGLVVMNKTSLEKNIYDQSNSNLSNNHIQSITQAPDGSVWIGTYDVIVARFDGSDFEEVTAVADPAINQNTQLYDFKIAPNGDFWIGLSNGVLRKTGQDWTHFDASEIGTGFFEAWDIAIDENGEVFVASNNLFQFENGTWNIINDETEIQNYLDSDLFFSSNGDLYMAGDLGKIGRYDGVDWDYFEVDFNGSEVLRLTEDVNGNIYFNSRNDGIFQLVNNTWVLQSDAQTALFDNRSDYFYIDQQNKRWLNTNIHLSVNDNGNIQSTLIAPHTLENNGIESVHKGENGKMYFLTFSRDNISFVDSDGNWDFLPLPVLTTPFEFLYDLQVFSDNNIWLATQSGLYHYTGNQWSFEALEPCRDIATDSQGKMYIRSDHRIYILDSGNISEYNNSNSSLSGLPITAHGIDGNDNLWIGTGDWDEQNVIQSRSTDGNWTTYSAADYPVIERPVGDFRFDNNGNVWVPNDNIGAIKFDGTTFSNPFINNTDQMANYRANAIEIDEEGTVYFSHQYGVTTLSNDTWEDLLIAQIPPVATSARTTMKFDDAGALWWGSNRLGVFSYDTQTSSTKPSPKETISNYSVYPNPASSFITLEFTLSEKVNVEIVVINQLGQMISKLQLGELSAGNFQEVIELNNFPKGVYNIQLRTDNNTFTKAIAVQ